LTALSGEFYTLREVKIVIESWRRHYNTIRPHASLGYKPPAPQVFVSPFAAWPAALIGHADAVYTAAFSGDGTQVVTASRDNTARLSGRTSACRFPKTTAQARECHCSLVSFDQPA
jgi:WD40 repeat protein